MVKPGWRESALDTRGHLFLVSLSALASKDPTPVLSALYRVMTRELSDLTDAMKRRGPAFLTFVPSSPPRGADAKKMPEIIIRNPELNREGMTVRFLRGDCLWWLCVDLFWRFPGLFFCYNAQSAVFWRWIGPFKC